MAQGKHLGSFGLKDAAQLALEGVGEDKFGLRKEFVGLVQLARGKGTPVGQAKTAP
jgi:Ca-activated chloride channel homolog